MHISIYIYIFAFVLHTVLIYFLLALVVLGRFCSSSHRGIDPHQTTVATHHEVVWNQLQSSLDDGLLEVEDIGHF